MLGQRSTYQMLARPERYGLFLRDALCFQSLLAPTVRVFNDSDPDGEAAVPLFYDGHAEDIICFVPARAGGGAPAGATSLGGTRPSVTG